MASESETSLIDFAVDFVQEARKDRPKHVRSDFSIRQAQSIALLGTGMIVERGAALGIEDLLQLAVRTTSPDDQGYAHAVALRVLLGDERESFLPQEGTGQEVPTELMPSSMPGSAPSRESMAQALERHRLSLKEVLDALHLRSSIDPSRGRDEMRQAQQFLQEVQQGLFGQDQQPASSQEQLERARRKIAFDLNGGFEGIQNRGIKDWEEMLEQARRQLLQKVPFGDLSTLAQGQLMGAGDQLREASLDPFVQRMTELLQDSGCPVQEGQDPFKDMSGSQLARCMDALEEYEALLDRMGIDPADYATGLEGMKESLADRLRQRASTLDDILRNPRAFQGDLSREDLMRTLQGSQHIEGPLDLLRKAHEADDLLDTDLADMAYQQTRDEYNDLDASTIASSPIMCNEWLDALQQAMAREEGMSWGQSSQLVQDLQDILERATTPSMIRQRVQESIAQACSNMIQQSRSLDQLASVTRQASDSGVTDLLRGDFGEWVDAQVPGSPTPEHLTDMIETSKRHQWPFSTDGVRRRGNELGMSPMEISALVGDGFEYVKHLIQNDDPSFERLDPLMQSLDLTEDMFDELLQESLQHDSSGGLASLAQQDLPRVASSIPQDKMSLFKKAMGAGPGENLLMQWYESGGELTGEMREVIKQTVKRVVIEMGKKKASSLIGSSEAGPIPDGTHVPYILGDDPDTIDLEETVNNILSKGKSIEQASVDDMIARKTVSGRRTVTFLIDTSGSMHGAPLAGAVLATSMLLHAFSRDELGVAIFESNTHVMCEVDTKVDIDTLMDTVLDLEAGGGTQMQRALAWAEEQFVRSSSSDRMLIMVTDAMIGDLYRSDIHFKNMDGMNVTSVLAVPEDTRGLGEIQALLNAANASLVPIGDWKEFPEVVGRILSRS